MSAKVGDQLPDGELKETTEFDSATQCAIGPKDVKIADAVRGKKIAVPMTSKARFNWQRDSFLPGIRLAFEARRERVTTVSW